MPLGAVKLTAGFCAPRLRTNREITLSAQYRLLDETVRVDDLRLRQARIQPNTGGPS
jgi:hypothetical protein